MRINETLKINPPVKQAAAGLGGYTQTGSSSLNNETLCNKIFRGGSGQDKILRLRLLRRNNVFFSPYVANRTVHRAEVVLHSRCAPVGSSAPPSGISARAWSRRSPLRRGPNLLGIMRTDRPERESVSSACPQDCSFDLKADDATSSAARPFAVSTILCLPCCLASGGSAIRFSGT